MRKKEGRQGIRRLGKKRKGGRKGGCIWEMEEKVRKGELVYRDNEGYLRKREKMYTMQALICRAYKCSR